MKTIFVSRAAAETIGPWPDWAIISIADGFHSLGDPKIKPGWADILRVKFDDVNQIKTDAEEYLILMEHEHAQQIVEFVRKNAHMEGILVHCLAGVSRSAAVVKWISKEFNLPFDKNYDKCNHHVFQLLVKASR